MHHPEAFVSLEEAFQPWSNAAYAAQFLRRLFGQTHDWAQAAGLYHSATPERGAAYRARVMAAWPLERHAGLWFLPPHPVIGRDGLIAPTRRAPLGAVSASAR